MKETIEIMKVRKVEALRKLEFLQAPKMAKASKKDQDKKVSVNRYWVIGLVVTYLVYVFRRKRRRQGRS